MTTDYQIYQKIIRVKYKVLGKKKKINRTTDQEKIQLTQRAGDNFLNAN